jgi:hypothetical protein
MICIIMDIYQLCESDTDVWIELILFLIIIINVINIVIITIIISLTTLLSFNEFLMNNNFKYLIDLVNII